LENVVKVVDSSVMFAAEDRQRAAVSESPRYVRIVVVEDDPSPVRPLVEGLRTRGFVVTIATAGASPALWTSQQQPDAVILDLTLPLPAGYEVLRQLRAQVLWPPLLVLAPVDGKYDETEAFALGADDYLTKPFRLPIVAARLRALVRRGFSSRPTVLSAGSLTLDPVSRVVTRAGRYIALTRTEFRVLEYLVRHKDTVVTRSEILQSAWDQPFRGAKNIVEVYVRNLRLKIDTPFGTQTIEMMRSDGYRLLSASVSD
jgi:two-component system OmpR family response regulator